MPGLRALEAFGPVLFEAGQGLLGGQPAQAPGFQFTPAIGPRDVRSGQVELARRDAGTKESLPQEGLAERIPALLDEIQGALFEKARLFREAHTTRVDTYDDFKEALDGEGGFLADIFVHEDYRGQGVGRALVNALRQWFVARGVQHPPLHEETHVAEGILIFLALVPCAI